MATDRSEYRRDEGVERRFRCEGKLTAATLLPIVRAAMARGEGPPALLSWVKRQGQSLSLMPNWTHADEARARILARRLAVTLNDRCRADAVTEQLGLTLGPEPLAERQYE